MAANLFKEGLQAAEDFASTKLRKFFRVVTNYQDKMESTLVEMQKINALISGQMRTDWSKWKEKEAPEPPIASRTLEPRRSAEQVVATAWDPEEPEATEEGGRSSKRPHTIGKRSASKSTPDPIAKRTRAGVSNPEGSAASPTVGGRPSQSPQDGSYEEDEEYNFRRTPGGSAARH